MKTSPSVNEASVDNNPLYISTKGIDLLFSHAPTITIVAGLLGLAATLSSWSDAFAPSQQSDTTVSDAEAQALTDTVGAIPVGMWILLGLVVLLAVFLIIAVSILLKSMLDYTSAQTAKGKSTTITDALRASIATFWSYTWVQVIVFVKVLLWSLLLIIPGIIMAVRYSLSGVSFHGKDLRGNAAVLHSSGLVKGAWLTTFASQNLLNILTLGVLQPVFTTGANAVLYRDLSRESKPRAHILSWIMLLVPLTAILLLMALVIVFGFFVASFAS